MEIITRNSKGITNKGYGGHGCYVSLTNIKKSACLNFTRDCVKKFDLKINDEIAFVADRDRLQFFITEAGDGFKLVNHKNVGLRIYSVTLVKKLFSIYPRLKTNYQRLPLRKSVSTVHGKELIEILMDRKL